MSFLPGMVTGQTYAPTNVLYSDKGLIEGAGTIDSTKAYDGSNTGFEHQLRAGLFLARITASKLWVPCKRSTVTSTGGATSTNVPVVDARTFRVGDVLTVGSNTLWTVTSINYGTNTLTGTSITFNSSDPVHATDGSEHALAVSNMFIELADIRFDGVWRNKPFAHSILAGMVDYSKILGDLAAVRADTSNGLGQILWNDLAGQV